MTCIFAGTFEACSLDRVSFRSDSGCVRNQRTEPAMTNDPDRPWSWCRCGCCTTRPCLCEKTCPDHPTTKSEERS